MIEKNEHANKEADEHDLSKTLFQFASMKIYRTHSKNIFFLNHKTPVKDIWGVLRLKCCL